MSPGIVGSVPPPLPPPASATTARALDPAAKRYPEHAMPTPAGGERTILHADLDAFFASVEQRDRPELRGKPVLVGDPGRRGVVAAASYEARRFGCRSAMPSAVARRLCPQAVFVEPDFARYKAASQAVFEVFERFTPLIEPLSIDEAFLDVTASRRLLGDGQTIARAIKAQVLERTGLTISLGVAPNKLVAKIASDLDKPDGLVVVPNDGVEAFLAPLTIDRLWGVGPSARQRLHARGIRTFQDVQRLDRPALRALLGVLGERLYERCRGIDDRPVVTDHQAKSIGHERTFAQDLRSIEACRAQVVDLAERVAWRLRRAGRAAGVLTLKVRNGAFRTVTRSGRLAEPTDHSGRIVSHALGLLDGWAQEGFEPVRLLGVIAGGLLAWQGPGLFDACEQARDRRVDQAADAIRARFGPGAIARARALDAGR
ncbi:MAG: DNA polymerase IV [Phycisphaerales bacterium]|nr:MAG: DNA polymerase IV [Phycisphaerales bacterium]